MKVLLINCVYKVGSTGKIVFDTQQYLEANGHEVYVAFGNKGESKLPYAYRFCTLTEARIHSRLAMFGRNQYKGLCAPTRRLLNYIEEVKPDIVHVHCANGFTVNLFALFEHLKKNDIKTVVTHHAEFYYTGSCGHAFDCEQWFRNECKECPRPQSSTFNRIFANPHADWIKMYSAFKGFKKENLVFTSVSPWVNKRAVMSPITNGYDHRVVLNGLDTNVFHHYDRSCISDKRLSSIQQDKIIFHATAVFNANDPSYPKGGYYIKELAKRMPDVAFVVASLATQDADNLPDNLILWGRTQSQVELAQLYSISDLCVITSNRETFSMVTAESLCCGTPVVGFMAGGPESIALSEFSSFVEYGNIDELEMKIKECLASKHDYDLIQSRASALYSKETMASNYLEIYKSLL